MTLTKGELIKMLQENEQSMEAPIQVYLEAENDDRGVMSLGVESLEYNKHQKAIVISGTYKEGD